MHGRNFKEAIEDIAVANGLRRYIHEKGKAPEYVDEFDEKADETKLAAWLTWEAGDSSMKIIIKLNVKSTPAQMLAGCKSVRKSVSGNVYFFAGGVVSCSLKRQQTVAQSTTEAEYYALAKAVSEALWLKQIMGQMMYLGADIKSVRLYGDNQGLLSLAENPEFHQRTKHIDVKHHFIRQHVAKRAVDL